MSNNKTVTTMSYKEARRLRKQNKLKSSTSDKIFNAINAVFMQTLVSGGIVEAIQFLKESAKNSDAEGFRLMQEWRALAKKEAKEVFNIK